MAVISVQVRGDSTIVAEVAAWRPSEQVLVVFLEGTDRLIPAHKILKIADQSGADRTRFVVDGRGTIGSYPDAYRGSRKAQSVALRPLVVVAVVAVAIGVALAVVIVFTAEGNELY